MTWENASPDDFMRRQAFDRLTVELDGAVGHRAVFRSKKAGDRFQRRRLAGAVRAEQINDLPASHR